MAIQKDNSNMGGLTPRRERQFLIDRKNVAILAESGKSPQEIAEELGVTVRTVYNHFQALKLQWQEQASASNEAARVRELDELEELENEALELWRASGDAKLLDRVLKIKAQKARLRGLYSETLQVEHTGDAQSVTVVFSGVPTAPTLASPVMLSQGPPAALGEPQDALPAIDLTELELEPEEVE